MIFCKISYQTPLQHFINFELEINQIESDQIFLRLPSWRPGRYSIQNYAKNIQKFAVEDDSGNPVSFQKLAKDQWCVQTSGVKKIKVIYNYFANQMDAGSSWLDNQQIYINWVNCMFWVEDRMEDAYQIELDIPDNYQIATNLKIEGKRLFASNFYELVDSPIIASNQLKHKMFQVQEKIFHLWIMGNCQPNWDKVIADFTKFTQEQINVFGGFPTDEYHYLFQILPYKHYHGVEHANSTVITLGPDEEFEESDFYNNLLGISSHELFHTWNATRLRPTELTPYDFTKESYFDTGFIIEGVTTYYGDYMLAKSGVFSLEEYVKELNIYLKRHFSNGGRFNRSLAESSTDLWLDGYELGIPNRKVSIYIKGALIAFILDIKIRKATQNQKSLDTVMRKFWKKLGTDSKGYTWRDYKLVAEEVIGQNLDQYFEGFVLGNDSLEQILQESFKDLGFDFYPKEMENQPLQHWGVLLNNSANTFKVKAIAQNSNAAHKISIGDELIALNGKKLNKTNVAHLASKTPQIEITFFRNEVLGSSTLEKLEENPFSIYQIKLKEELDATHKLNLEAWLPKLSL